MTIPEFNDLRSRKPALLVYFSTPSCNVCRILRPKIEALLEARFPEMEFLYIDMEASPELPGQHSVFAAPTILVFFEGREAFRKSRHFGIGELARDIERPYGLLVG